MDITSNNETQPVYCVVPVVDTDLITETIENDKTVSTDEVLSFEDEKTRLNFTLKVLLIFLLQAVEVGVIVMIVIACREIEWNQIGYIALGFSTWIYLFTLCAMVSTQLPCDLLLHWSRTYDYFLLVFCPATDALLIISLLAVSYAWYERYLLIMVFFSWLCYVTSSVIVLAFVYCTLRFEQKNTPEYLIYAIALVAFAFTYYGGIAFKVYSSNDFGIVYLSGPAISSGIFLYLHHLYVLYDINAMTGSNYRLTMTPDDYVKGAVNLQIDFVFMIKDYFMRVFYNIINTENKLKNDSEDPKVIDSADLIDDSVPAQPAVGFLTLEQTVDIDDELAQCQNYSECRCSNLSSDVPLIHRPTVGLRMVGQTRRNSA